MLKIALARPYLDAVSRGDGANPSGGDGRSTWRAGVDDEGEPSVRALSRSEAQALCLRQPALSPWRVVAAQALAGMISAACAWLLAGRIDVVLSALYGAAIVAIPGALMARGATSPLSSISPLVSAASMMGWALVKTVATIVMLVLAPRVVPGLDWPTMLATLVVCLSTYWFALLWRGRAN